MNEDERVRRHRARPRRRGRPGRCCTACAAPGTAPCEAPRGRHRLRRRRLREARRRSAAAARRGPRPRQLPPRRGPFPRRVRGRGRRRRRRSPRSRCPSSAARPTTGRGARGPTRSSSPPSRPSRTAAPTAPTCCDRLVRARPAAPGPRGAAQAALQAGRAHHAHRGAALPEARASGSPADCPPTSAWCTGTWARSSTAPTCWSPSPPRPPWSPCTAASRPRSSPTSASARPSATTTSSAPAAWPPGTSSTPGTGPTPDPEWLARQGVAADGSYATAFDAARERVAELLDGPTDCRRSRRTTHPPPRPAICPASSPATTSPPTAPRCPARRPTAEQHRLRRRLRADRARGGARRVPPRRAARGPRHPPDGGAVTAARPRRTPAGVDRTRGARDRSSP